jgi:predicted HAD superfamily hydrolase
MLFENETYAGQFTPLLRLVTDDIEEVYEKISSKHPELLHPNLSQVTLRPWGAKEFALLDRQIGIVIQQW